MCGKYTFGEFQPSVQLLMGRDVRVADYVVITDERASWQPIFEHVCSVLLALLELGGLEPFSRGRTLCDGVPTIVAVLLFGLIIGV